MKRPVAFRSGNLQSVLFALRTLDFRVANARGPSPACDQPYTHYNLAELLHERVPIANGFHRPAGIGSVRAQSERPAKAAGMAVRG